MDKIKEYLHKEICSYNKFEKIFCIVSLSVLISASVIKSDSILAILASVFGLLYTITSGKGKLYCYYFGIISTLSCGIVSFQISLYGNSLLHLFYYFPMEIIGIYSWKQHLQSNSNEIIKTKLTPLGLVALIVSTTFLTLIFWKFFINIKDLSPLPDSLILILSISGMVLTVKRCIEQWFVWTLVNMCSVWLWLEVFFQGERTFSILLVRIIYLVLGIYFFFTWKKSLSKSI